MQKNINDKSISKDTDEEQNTHHEAGKHMQDHRMLKYERSQDAKHARAQDAKT